MIEIAIICFFLLCIMLTDITICDEMRLDYKHRHRNRRSFKGNMSSHHISANSSNPHHSTGNRYKGFKITSNFHLPAFSYDYSMLLISAMIERQSPNELYLTIFTANLHNLMNDPTIIEALYTDISMIESWNQAKRRLNSSIEDLSNLICNIHNNDPKHRHSYHVQAKRISGYTMNSKSAFNAHFDVIHCKLRGVSSIISSLSQSEHSLQVDLIRRSTKHSHNYGSSNTESDNISGASQSTHIDPRTLIISFTVPWKHRYTGYGFNQYTNKGSFMSSLDPWMISSEQRSVNEYKHSRNDTTNKIALCVGISQPKHASRSNIPLPWLIEFLEYHLSSRVGYDHVFLGLLIDFSSNEFNKYEHVLQSYIKNGTLSLISLAYDGYDDVGGFSSIGIVFRQTSKYLQELFYNQCLYYCKGMFDAVTAIDPNDLILFMDDKTDVKSLYKVSIDLMSSNIPSRLLTTKKGHSIQGKMAHRHNNSSIRHDSTSSICYPNQNIHSLGRMFSFAISDPSDSFGGWGPGESSWFIDYFKTSVSFGPLKKSPLLLIPTKPIALYFNDNVVVFSCQANQTDSSSHRQYFSHYIATSNKSNPHSMSGNSPYIVETAKSSTLSRDLVVLVTYQGIEPNDIRDMPLANFVSDSILSSVVDNQLRKAYDFIRKLLDSKGFSTAVALKSRWSGVIQNNNHNMRTRADIKAPYWKTLKENEYLANEITRIFTQ